MVHCHGASVHQCLQAEAHYLESKKQSQETLNIYILPVPHRITLCRTHKKPEEMPKPVTVRDMVDFFLRFMRNEQVGRICNMHLAIADATPMVYARSPVCEALAMLNSVAVDFGKTGIPVDPREVNNIVGNVEYPDFMGGTRKSDTVIGRIFRDASERNDQAMKELFEPDNELEDCLRGAKSRVVYAWIDDVAPLSEEGAQWAEAKVSEWTADFSDMMATCAPVYWNESICGHFFRSSRFTF